MYLLFGSLALVYFAYKVLTSVLPNYLIVPPTNWQDKIKTVIEYSKPIYLQVGHKRSSYRRRLVLASSQPSFYTNYVNNKLKVCPSDYNEDFLTEMRRRDVNDPNRRILYGFFHPYANNGGGGERVLWQAVKATLVADQKNIAVIYTTNTDAEPLDILKKAEEKFQITDLDSRRVLFVYLRRFGHLIDGQYWKRLTMVGQLWGAALLALEAMFELSPDVWIDTIGLPGSYIPALWILKVPILAYVHYPIIQNDMFNKLKFKHLKDIIGARSVGDVKDAAKLIYWSALYYFYTYLGSLVDIVLTNGTWTYNHLESIFVLNRGIGNKMEILYPPCGTENLPLSAPNAPKENKLLYIAQFRPEKRHLLILNEYHQFLSKFKQSKSPIKELPTIVFLGSCRTSDDTATLVSVKNRVAELELTEYVEFVVDCSYDEVVEWLAKAKFGLNGMWNEHFGIGVVEYLGRVIPLCHASAGPYLDIVTPWAKDKQEQDWYNDTGFFFKSELDPDFDPSIQVAEDENLVFEYQDKKLEFPSFSNLLTRLFITNRELISEDILAEMRSNGALLVLEKFSNKTFDVQWMKYIGALETLEKTYREDKRPRVEQVH
ncbi:glycosyltransferase family 4 protein [Suhomyces tanzawaensis NRRL Y-17324]|uniref:GDP-Man:Man(3)GlcNAc(2)-PP-Dol alpha-1,2-mannosyltransferase n=1 Tax=Suhomyces tanzawaensis NRRL Y-17324 TaxID=984487 RepID=A0A1E4SR14_9ASCO|nr:glycosyltransferase family 4 protein [Suhomyces tanzawaensis NRRL Y-17324]ODV81944.1 glycosyltransferase family 4 protein [Suhomyces tanzawaensis NRRL Y-17324]